MILYSIERPPRNSIPPQNFPKRKPSRFVSSICLGAREHRGEAVSSRSFPHQESRRSCFARAPSRPKFGDSFLRELRLALISRLGSSLSWLREPFFEAYRKISRKLLMHHVIVVRGLTLHGYRCSLARATGPFSSHGNFCLVQRNGRANRLREARGDTTNFLINRTPCLYLDTATLTEHFSCRHFFAITLLSDSTRTRRVPSTQQIQRGGKSS